MGLKSKIEAVIYASEEPVTLQQLAGLLGGEAQAELDEMAAKQESLPLDGDATDTAEAVEFDENGAVLGAEEGDSGAENGDLNRLTQDAASETVSGAAEAAAGTVSDGQEPRAANQPVSEPASQPEAPTLDGGADAEDEAAEASAEDEKRAQRERERSVRDHIRRTVELLIREYAESDRGIEIREVASGYRMGTKPEYHDAVRGFVKSLKPALKLTLPALETLAVVAYKQPVTAAEISEIRGVDSAGVLGGLMTRKLIATAGRKQVIGRPMLYKTTREFLLRFGLKDIHELPSMEEFERMAGELAEQEDLPMESAEAVIEEANARGDAEMLREEAASQQASQQDGGEDAAANEDTASDAEEEQIQHAMEETAGTEDVAADELEIDNQEKATAESAAGGNDEEQHTEEAEPEQPVAEDGDDVSVEEEKHAGE